VGGITSLNFFMVMTMKKEEAFKVWEKAVGINTCIRCVLDPPSDRSICSDCASTHAKERAEKVIERITRETGWRASVKYKDGRDIWKLTKVRNNE